MTNGEATEVQALLRWVLGLTAFEHPGDAVDIPDDDDLIDIVGTLAERSHKVLGAGIDRNTAESKAFTLTRCYNLDDYCEDTLGDRAIETVDVQGALL